MGIVERVAARHIQTNVEHEKQLKQLSDLLVKGLSDRKITQTMGIDMTKAHALVEELRKMHGLSTLDNLRKYLKTRQ